MVRRDPYGMPTPYNHIRRREHLIPRGDQAVNLVSRDSIYVEELKGLTCRKPVCNMFFVRD